MAETNQELMPPSKPALLVREVQQSDFAQWKLLWDGYNAFYGRKDKTALPAEISLRTWS